MGWYPLKPVVILHNGRQKPAVGGIRLIGILLLRICQSVCKCVKCVEVLLVLGSACMHQSGWSMRFRLGNFDLVLQMSTSNVFSCHP